MFLLAAKPAKAEQPARVRVLAGAVQVLRLQASQFVPAVDGSTITKGETLRTLKDGRAEIQYFDGSVTRLNYDTIFKVVELSILRNKAGSKIIRARQTSGETFNRIVKLTDSQSRMEIETPSVTAAVRGTRFTVRVRGNHTDVKVLDGHVTGNEPGGAETDLFESDGATFGPDGATKYKLSSEDMQEAWIEYNECDLDGGDCGANKTIVEGTKIEGGPGESNTPNSNSNSNPNSNSNSDSNASNNQGNGGTNQNPPSLGNGSPANQDENPPAPEPPAPEPPAPEPPAPEPPAPEPPAPEPPAPEPPAPEPPAPEPPAPPTGPGSLHHLGLSPASSSITAGGSRSYVAQGFDANGVSLGNVTAGTVFTISPDGSCAAATCSVGSAGPHTVTGTNAGASGTAALTVNAGALDHLLLSPASSTIPAGGSQSYTASGFDAFGNPLGDVTDTTTFTIALADPCSGSCDAAEAAPCDAATCEVSTAGAYVVSGSSGDAGGTAALIVTPGSIDHLGLSPTGSTITAGDSQSYSAEGFDSLGNSLGDVTTATTFSISSDESCASFCGETAPSCEGATCSATQVGSYTVTGGAGEATGSASLVIAAAPLHHLALWPPNASIAAGDSQSYSAEGFDAFGNSLGDMTADTAFAISPESSCESVCDASVGASCDGASCTATTAGSYAVTGTSGTAQGGASLTVGGGPLASIVLSPPDAAIVAGGSRSFTAEGFDSFGNSLGDVTSETVFSISPDGSCTAAACTATASGPHSVTGTDGEVSANALLTVTGGPVASLSLSPGSSSITAGGSQSYTAAGFDAFGNSLGDVTGATTFTISPDGSCTSASCTATTPGAHTITGTDGAATGTASLAVNAGALHHLVLSPASATITAGATQAFTAEGFDSLGNSLGDVTGATTFSSSPDGSCTGVSCTATTPGAHTITGTDGAAAGTASLTVNAGALHHLVLSPATATITSGSSQSYTAAGFDSAGNPLGDVTGATSFSISPDGSCTGATCTPSTSGAHTVTGTDGAAGGTASLTVDAPGIHHIDISPSDATIELGQSQSYTVTAFDSPSHSIGVVTVSSTFDIVSDGSCSGATCTPTESGPHTVHAHYAGKTAVAHLTVNTKPKKSDVSSGNPTHVVPGLQTGIIPPAQLPGRSGLPPLPSGLDHKVPIPVIVPTLPQLPEAAAGDTLKLLPRPPGGSQPAPLTAITLPETLPPASSPAKDKLITLLK